jgi:hypothetical protein
MPGVFLSMVPLVRRERPRRSSPPPTRWPAAAFAKRSGACPTAEWPRPWLATIPIAVSAVRTATARTDGRRLGGLVDQCGPASEVAMPPIRTRSRAFRRPRSRRSIIMAEEAQARWVGAVGAMIEGRSIRRFAAKNASPPDQRHWQLRTKHAPPQPSVEHQMKPSPT